MWGNAQRYCTTPEARPPRVPEARGTLPEYFTLADLRDLYAVVAQGMFQEEGQSTKDGRWGDAAAIGDSYKDVGICSARGFRPAVIVLQLLRHSQLHLARLSAGGTCGR